MTWKIEKTIIYTSLTKSKLNIHAHIIIQLVKTIVTLRRNNFSPHFP